MHQLSELLQTADWKSEKHVPVIDCPDTFRKGEMTTVSVSVGKEIAHPNTTEHHIVWIDISFQPHDEKFPFQIAHFDFLAHGASMNGPNTSTVYTHHEGICRFKSDKPGTILASAYCNIHGFWQNAKEIGIMEAPATEKFSQPAMSGTPGT